MTRWASTDEVLALLGVSRAFLRRCMLSTPEHVHRPWTCYGGQAQRVRYRWEGPESMKRMSDD